MLFNPDDRRKPSQPAGVSGLTEQWKAFAGLLSASNDNFNEQALLSEVRQLIRHRRRRTLMLATAATVLVAVGLGSWAYTNRKVDQVIAAPTPPKSAPPQINEKSKIPVSPHIPIRQSPATSAEIQRNRRTQAHRWHDELAPVVANVQRDVRKAEASARRRVSEADLIRSELKQLESELRRSTL